MSDDARATRWWLVGALGFLLGTVLAIDPSRLRRGTPLDGEAEAVLATISLARDRDLVFDRADVEEATSVFGVTPPRLELVRAKDEMARLKRDMPGREVVPSGDAAL